MKDINFSNDGRRFLSTSYDKVVKLWDTETGQVQMSGHRYLCISYWCSGNVGRFCNKGIPHSRPVREAEVGVLITEGAACLWQGPLLHLLQYPAGC